MNYLSHAYRFFDEPYFVAGTALPDWMNVVDRRNRTRSQYAEPLRDSSDALVRDVARGVIQHHDDDRRFHQTSIFVELSTRFAVQARHYLAPGLGHQAGFLGHIVVELLLDWVLMDRDASRLTRYYEVLESLDASQLERAANLICRHPVDKLVVLLPRFINERFLADYSDDERLLWRLGGVMRRVKLPELPEDLIGWLATIRPIVAAHADELLAF
ncbi:MAG: hypothetical protein KDB03_08310 [Planctomycetales bacterium]|nr:hypothetical protein [Planctomycetales bacterium]